MKTIDNPEAEQSVLGALLLSPKRVGLVISGLSPKDFYREDHKQIYQAIIDIHEAGSPVDLVTVSHRLKARGQLEAVGGPLFLTGLSEQVGIAANVAYYAQIVKETALKRRLRETLHLIDREIDKPDELSTLFEFTDSQLSDFLSGLGRNNGNLEKQSYFSANDLLSKELRTPPEIIGNGIMPQGAGVFLTGDSGIGKSLLTLELAVRLSQGLELWGLPIKGAVKVLIMQAENPDYSMQFRLKRILSGLSLSEAPRLFLSPSTSRLNLNKATDRRALNSLISRIQAKVVILDPLISYHTTPENDNSQMRSFLDSLTEISQVTGAAWLLVHHHGRPQEGESRYRGASALKDWADSFLTLSAKASRDRTLLELAFVKVRHGAGRPPLFLERDNNFLHFPTQEDGLAPPSLVVTALEKLGGQCVGKALLAREIITLSGCSERTAYAAIGAAIGRGIDETDHGKKRIFFLQRGIAKPFLQEPFANE